MSFPGERSALIGMGAARLSSGVLQPCAQPGRQGGVKPGGSGSAPGPLRTGCQPCSLSGIRIPSDRNRHKSDSNIGACGCAFPALLWSLGGHKQDPALVSPARRTERDRSHRNTLGPRPISAPVLELCYRASIRSVVRCRLDGLKSGRGLLVIAHFIPQCLWVLANASGSLWSSSVTRATFKKQFPTRCPQAGWSAYAGQVK